MKKTFLICLFFMVHNLCGSLTQERKDYLKNVTVEDLRLNLTKIITDHENFMKKHDYDYMSNCACDFMSRHHNHFVDEHARRCLKYKKYLEAQLQLKQRESLCYSCLQCFGCLKYYPNVELAQKDCCEIQRKLQVIEDSLYSMSYRDLHSSSMDPHS